MGKKGREIVEVDINELLESPSAARIYEKLYPRDGQRRTSNLPLNIDDLCRVLEKDLFLVRRHRSLGVREMAVTLHE